MTAPSTVMVAMTVGDTGYTAADIFVWPRDDMTALPFPFVVCVKKAIKMVSCKWSVFLFLYILGLH